jgi:hypothetical protein
MNERIKELAEQAGFLYDISVGIVAGPEASPHKFAELIVRECLDKVNEAVYAREMTGRYYPDTDGKKILKHFGVEE